MVVEKIKWDDLCKVYCMNLVYRRFIEDVWLLVYLGFIYVIVTCRYFIYWRERFLRNGFFKVNVLNEKERCSFL